MNIQYIVLIFVVFNANRVKSECADDYLKCFGEFIHGFFVNNDNNNLTNIVNDTKVVKYNLTTNYFEIKEAEEELDKILDDATKLLQKQLEDIFKIATESDVFKYIDNKTTIYVKTLEVDKHSSKDVLQNNGTIDIVTNVPQIIINNVNIDNFSNITSHIENITSIMNLNHTINKNTDKVPRNISYVETVISLTSPNDIINVITENPEKNIIDNEIINTVNYYDIEEDNSTDYPIIDYIELYKDTTNEYVEYKPTEIPTNTEISEEITKQDREIDNVIEYSLQTINEDNFENQNNTSNSITNLPRSCDGNNTEGIISEVVFPWIAAIFIKNDANNQFDYYCDGALLSERTVLTGARCVDGSNGTLQADNILIVLGKRSLQSTNENETAYKVKQIMVHENFTKDGDTRDDLAILVLEGRVTFNEAVSAACVADMEDNITEAATTGWRITGELTPIYFENEGSKRCERNTKAENIFCAVYGNQVTVCPSFGGMYVAKHTNRSWYLQGMLTGDPTMRGICISKTVTYTSLNNYNQWIKQSIHLINK